jgi:long-subunit fatty acid transport protein
VLAVTKQYGSPIETPEGYKDTHGVRLGAEYTGPAIFRVGIDVHGAAAPDQTVTPRLPEASRWEVGAGVGLPAAAHLRFDFGYLYVHQSDREGRTGELPNNGLYKYHANLFSGMVVLHF